MRSRRGGGPAARGALSTARPPAQRGARAHPAPPRSPSPAAPPPRRSELERQGEQLDRVQRKLDATEAHADRSNWILKGMKSMFSFRGKEPPKPKEVVAEREAARAAKDGGGGGGGGGGGAAGAGAGAGPGGRSRQQQQQQAAAAPVDLKTAKVAKGARTEEDDLLDALSGSVARIKNVATGIGDELNRQDKTIDSIGTSVERVDGKVKTATRDAKKLAR